MLPTPLLTILSSTGHDPVSPVASRRRPSDRRGGSMSKYRLFSMLLYGAAALVGAVVVLLTGLSAVFAVGVPVVLAAATDRFINRNAEPDDRMRSFVIYALGGATGMIVMLVAATRLGGWAFVVPLVAFGVSALVD